MYLVPANNVVGFLSALSRLMLKNAVFRAYLALGATAIALCFLLASCRTYCLISIEVFLAPFAYIYVHETAQYIALGVDVELRLEEGYVVLEPRGNPKRPRGAVVAGALAPAVVGLASLPYAPLFSLIVLLSVALTLARYVGG
ncbi:MAG: hypothetical protein ACP5MH_08990 [Thermoproteus sp.]